MNPCKWTSNTMEPSTIFIPIMIMASMVVSAGSSDVIIHTTHGDVRGEVTSVLDRQVTVYWGIPYAKIPARFQRPESADAWEGVLDATTPPPSCPDVPYTSLIRLIPPTSTPFNEDCLYLNLWVPQGCADKADAEGLAVMVWIHGGALEFGSSTVPSYNGQVLAATQCVIVASLNYRLGALGFVTLGTASAPGNVGLLDQVMALKWIHSNARNFGGSARRITLFGESAGGLSIALHMASPLSQDLFSQAIIQSAPLHSSRGGARDSVAGGIAATRKLAEALGCPGHDDDAVLTCLLQADSEDMGKMAADRTRFKFPAFEVIVDGYFLEKPLSESFFSTRPKKMNLMIGTTKDDGSTALSLYSGKRTIEAQKPQMDQTAFYTVLMNRVFPMFPDQPKNKRLLAKLLEYVYINSSLPERRDDYLIALNNVFGDVVFFCPQYKVMASMHAASEVFMYSFEHRSSVSPFPEWMGVVHASEIDFVFGRPLDQGPAFREEEKQLSRLMMTAWANFAKFGNPNSEGAATPWPPINNATYPYAVFQSPTDISIENGRRYRQCAFWNEAYTALVTTEPAATEDEHKKHTEL